MICARTKAWVGRNAAFACPTPYRNRATATSTRVVGFIGRSPFVGYDLEDCPARRTDAGAMQGQWPVALRRDRTGRLEQRVPLLPQTRQPGRNGRAGRGFFRPPTFLPAGSL